MYPTPLRGRVAVLISLGLLVLAPAPVFASAPIISCSLDGGVLSVDLAADDPSFPATTRIVVLDRSGTIGVEDGLATGVWLSCGGATVRSVSTVRVIGSQAADEVWISADGGGASAYAFPTSVSFEIDLGAEEGTPEGGGDVLGLAVRRDGGSAVLGDGVFEIGAATGTVVDAELGVLRVGFSRAGLGRSVLDAAAAPAGLSVTLVGGAAPDLIIGGHGDDFLLGEGSGDLLDGGEGFDVLVGGGGRDRCARGEDVLCEVVAA